MLGALEPPTLIKFGGPEDPLTPPTFAYPESGIIVPPNMNSLELHFVPGVGQDLFELTFESPSLKFVVYMGCTPLGGGCVYEPDASFWTKLAEAARGDAQVTYQLRGVYGADPQVVGISEQQTIAFSGEDIVGGLYYWNDVGVIQRFDFGLPNAVAELYMNAPQAGAGVCVGCHAVSPDGKKMVVGKDIPAPAPFTVFDVATKQPVQSTGGPISGAGNFFAFSPDSNQLLVSNGAKIAWRDTSTGNLVNDTVVPNGTMPDWSPDGSFMVYARTSAPLPVATPGISSGSIDIMPFASGSFGAASVLVQNGGDNNYYPAIAPDSQWIVFNKSPSNTESFSNTVDGELWAVHRDGGTPVRLSAASDPGWTSWPKWAPGLHSTGNRSVMYFTFSTARAYGLRLADNEKTQLWMAAFDPAAAASGADPATPAFRLPFQDIGSGNHIAQWVADIVRKPCTESTQCDGGEKCQNGECVPAIQ